MVVPWDRISRSRNKQQQQQWHPAIRKWDLKDDGGDSLEASVKGILRLLRQQLIAWASAGHSASPSELSARGIEESLPFSVMSQTSNPCQDFREKARENHPMLLELKRTLAGSSGFYEVLCFKNGEPAR